MDSGDRTSRIRIVTLFPDLFACWLQQGVVARAVERHVASVDLVHLREFGIGRHRVTDDYPFGGGAGMVMKPEPMFAAIESLQLKDTVPVILLSPRGRPFRQRVAEELSRVREFVLISGHYEGVDERVRQHLVDDEVSIGDYVVSAGELAAMVVTDAVVRLLPGALRTESTHEESFEDGLLEYPQYTRPATFRGWAVPDVLLSGHHAEVARWRRHHAFLATVEQRPDLLVSAELSRAERELLAQASDQSGARDSDQNSVDESPIRNA